MLPPRRNKPTATRRFARMQEGNGLPRKIAIDKTLPAQPASKPPRRCARANSHPGSAHSKAMPNQSLSPRNTSTLSDNCKIRNGSANTCSKPAMSEKAPRLHLRHRHPTHSLIAGYMGLLQARTRLPQVRKLSRGSQSNRPPDSTIMGIAAKASQAFRCASKYPSA